MKSTDIKIVLEQEIIPLQEIIIRTEDPLIIDLKVHWRMFIKITEELRR